MKKLILLSLSIFFTCILFAQNVPYFSKRVSHTEKHSIKLDTITIGKDTTMTNFGDVELVSYVKEKPLIFFYAAGAFKVSGTNPDPETKTTSGELGFTFVNHQSMYATLGFCLNTVGEVDTKKENFANALLVPGFGNNSFFCDFRKFDLYKNLGIGAEANWTVSNWKWVDNDSIEQTLSAAPILLKIFVTWVPFSPSADNYEKSTNKFTLAFDLGYSMRALANEAAQNKEFLLDKFKTDKTTYYGIELGISARLNDSKVFSNISYLSKGKDRLNVPGLTGLQVVFGVALSGNLLRIN